MRAGGTGCGFDAAGHGIGRVEGGVKDHRILDKGIWRDAPQQGRHPGGERERRRTLLAGAAARKRRGRLGDCSGIAGLTFVCRPPASAVGTTVQPFPAWLPEGLCWDSPSRRVVGASQPERRVPKQQLTWSGWSAPPAQRPRHQGNPPPHGPAPAPAGTPPRRDGAPGRPWH